MMKKILLFFVVLGYVGVLGCANKSSNISYDQDSRKTIIPSKCTSFFDGCNTCNKGKDDTVACTMKYCEKYEKPKCLDKMDPSRDKDNDTINDCEKEGICDDTVDYTKQREKVTDKNQN